MIILKRLNSVFDRLLSSDGGVDVDVDDPGFVPDDEDEEEDEEEEE